MLERMDWPHLYRVQVKDVTGTNGFDVVILTFFGQPKAEWFGREAHRARRLPWAIETIDATDLGPAPKTDEGYPTGPPGFLDDQAEF
jgi:hypothetical protein